MQAYIADRNKHNKSYSAPKTKWHEEFISLLKFKRQRKLQLSQGMKILEGLLLTISAGPLVAS